MISIDNRDPRPLYEQVVDGFARLITAGVLVADDKLPSVRSLAAQLAINPNTIQRAYRELETLGYTYSAPGRGSFVAAGDAAQAARKLELLAQFDVVVADLQQLGVSCDQLKQRLDELCAGQSGEAGAQTGGRSEHDQS